MFEGQRSHFQNCTIRVILMVVKFKTGNKDVWEHCKKGDLLESISQNITLEFHQALLELLRRDQNSTWPLSGTEYKETLH